MKIKFTGQMFEKFLIIEFNENPSCGSRVIPSVCLSVSVSQSVSLTDWHDEASRRFSEFCERA